MSWLSGTNILLVLLALSNVASCKGFSPNTNDVCQYSSTKGRDYKGTANTTIAGVPCQKWSHMFSYLGDHSFCRSPVGTSFPSVWCWTNFGPQPCPVPICPPQKVLDFSLDNDWQPDANGSFTKATLHLENFPSSFTICSAFMLDKWGPSAQNSPLFLLLDPDDHWWLYVELNAVPDFPEFVVILSGNQFTVSSPLHFFPKQWTRVCISFNSDNSLAYFAVDGTQLLEKNVTLDEKQSNLTLVVGWMDPSTETPGMVTDFNIFSTPFSNISKAGTMAGSEYCGAQGVYLSWEKAEWTLHSKARIIEMDSAKGPCRKESEMHIYHMAEVHYQKDCMYLCEKLGGRSPSVGTMTEWETFADEVQHISNERLVLPCTVSD